MKILIIATRRSGGSNLGKWISMEKGLDYIYEPNITDNFIVDNIVTKIIYEEHNEEKIKKISKEFDKVIIHKRINIVHQAESWTHSQINNSYDKKYSIKPKFLEKNINLYYKLYNNLVINNDKLNNLNIGIQTTYEEIFSDEYDWTFLLKYLEIEKPKYLHFLNNKNKYRDTKKQKLL
jgi:hypothetical protein